MIGAFGGPLLPVRPFLRVPEGVLVLPQPPGNPLFLDCAGNNAPFHELHDAAHPAAHARHNSMTPNARVELRRRLAEQAPMVAAEEVETSLVGRAIPPAARSPSTTAAPIRSGAKRDEWVEAPTARRGTAASAGEAAAAAQLTCALRGEAARRAPAAAGGRAAAAQHHRRVSTRRPGWRSHTWVWNGWGWARWRR